MTKPLNIGAEFSIARDDGAIEVERPITLASQLIALSEQTKRCYDTALAENRNDVARELVLLARATATLIARSLRDQLEGKTS